jgi:hypothetical protein
MQLAIALLSRHVESCDAVIPVLAKLGETDAADLNRRTAEECRAAIEALESIARFDACMPDLPED